MGRQITLNMPEKHQISAAYPQEVLSRSPRTLHPGTGRYRCVHRTYLQRFPKRLQQ